MNKSDNLDKSNWQRFCDYFFYDERLGLQLDISRVKFEEDYLTKMEPRMQAIYAQITDLEDGAIANPDENRMVGHYWLRKPEIAPEKKITQEINTTLQTIKDFTRQIHTGILRGEKAGLFQNVLIIGIGGSSLGPRFVSDALGGAKDKLKLFFIDNTDPDGIDKVLSLLQGKLDTTLTVVISKSGGTIETRNGMEEVKRLYLAQGLDFAKHAVSISQEGSMLDRLRKEEGWLMAFPMWDWVGGRTSVLSAVGILPLALQGLDIDLLLEGAQRCDELTRRADTRKNPSALLALMWYAVTEGRGGKQMVVLPYKDRLELLTKYLQQLIMESLGKETDLDGKVVNQGIAVLGNKGSTDQHSYLQQLLDGPANFFVTFIEVLKDRAGASPLIAEESTSGDYLQAFFLGTRNALSQKGRDSITITIQEIDALSIGVLLALYERAVSIYALLVNINAYHQPGVELGKKAAGEVILLKNQAVSFLRSQQGRKYTVEELAEELVRQSAVYQVNQSANNLAEETKESLAPKLKYIDCEMLYKILQHLVNNPENRVTAHKGKDSDGKEFIGYSISS